MEYILILWQQRHKVWAEFSIYFKDKYLFANVHVLNYVSPKLNRLNLILNFKLDLNLHRRHKFSAGWTKCWSLKIRTWWNIPTLFFNKSLWGLKSNFGLNLIDPRSSYIYYYNIQWHFSVFYTLLEFLLSLTAGLVFFAKSIYSHFTLVEYIL